MALQNRRGGGFSPNSGHHRDHGGMHSHQQSGRVTRWSDKDDKSSLEAAAEAAAKVNAMLIAKGALKPSQLSQQQATSKQKTTSVPGNMAFAEVEINDVPIGCRNMLTRGSTQEEISKASGAGVSTRGRYLTPQERNQGGSDRPLYLCIQSPSKESVDIAVNRINEIINNYKNKGSRFSPANPPLQTRPQLIADPGPRAAPPPGFITQPPTLPPPQTVVLQEKLYIGLEHAPPNFGVKDKILGPEGTYLHHIEVETAAKVTLRGKGSAFLDITGRDSIEPMHVFLEHTNPIGLGQAKQLAENLIQTVQQDYAQFQQALAALPAGHATIIAGLSQQTSMPGTLINPGLTTVPTMAPPPTVQQLPSPGGTTRIMVPSSLAPVQALPPGPIASSLGISAPSVLTAQPPPIFVQTQAGPPPQLLGHPQIPADQLVTSMPPEVPVVSQATIIPSPWGPPHSSIPTQIISRNSPPAASAPSLLSSTPHVTTSYSYAPREEPRRRFTEEKVEDKVPENLLGYEHGPPHLANLVVQGTPQQSPHEPIVSTHPPYQPQVSEMYSVATTVQPIQSSASPQAEDRNFSPVQGVVYGDDKQLMPPPPIPASLKRPSMDRLDAGARKKERLSPTDYREEEDKSRGKYQYNHISNAPQLYTQAEADNFQDQRPPADNEPPPGYQFQPPQSITEQYQYQPGQQPGTHLLPPPPAPLSVMSTHHIQQPMYSISPSQSPPNIYTQQQEVLTSTGHPYPTHTITLSGPPQAPEQILAPPPEARPEDIQPPLEQLQQPPPSYATMPPPPISSSQYLTSPQTMPLMAPPAQPPALSVQPPNYPPPGMPYYITSQ